MVNSKEKPNCPKVKTTGPLHNARYKLKMCRQFEKHGVCPYYQKCQFAHGAAELNKWKRYHEKVKRNEDSKPLEGKKKEKGELKRKEKSKSRQRSATEPSKRPSTSKKIVPKRKSSLVSLRSVKENEDEEYIEQVSSPDSENSFFPLPFVSDRSPFSSFENDVAPLDELSFLQLPPSAACSLDSSSSNRSNSSEFSKATGFSDDFNLASNSFDELVEENERVTPFSNYFRKRQDSYEKNHLNYRPVDQLFYTPTFSLFDSQHVESSANFRRPESAQAA